MIAFLELLVGFSGYRLLQSCVLCATPVVLLAVVLVLIVEALPIWPVSCGQTMPGECCRPLLSTHGVGVCERVGEALLVALDRWRL